MSDKCPKCGAEVSAGAVAGYLAMRPRGEPDDGTIIYKCGRSTNYPDRDYPKCLRRQLAQRDAIIDKLPKCWRLVDGAPVQDVPVVGLGKYRFICPRTGLRSATVTSIDYSKDRIGLIVSGHPPYLQGLKTVKSSQLYETDEAAEFAIATVTKEQEERRSKSTVRTRAIAKQLAETMQCNCDLDKWQPERSTGHSFVCRIHKAALKQAAAATEAQAAAAREKEGK